MLKFKDEMIYTGVVFILLNILMKIVFYKEAILNTFKISFGVFWLFVIPGYFLMYYWREELDFFSRLVIGSGISGALIGMLSYYIGLIGLNLKYQAVVLPVIVILVALFFYKFKNKAKAE